MTSSPIPDADPCKRPAIRLSAARHAGAAPWLHCHPPPGAGQGPGRVLACRRLSPGAPPNGPIVARRSARRSRLERVNDIRHLDNTAPVEECANKAAVGWALRVSVAVGGGLRGGGAAIGQYLSCATRTADMVGGICSMSVTTGAGRWEAQQFLVTIRDSNAVRKAYRDVGAARRAGTPPAARRAVKPGVRKRSRQRPAGPIAKLEFRRESDCRQLVAMR